MYAFLFDIDGTLLRCGGAGAKAIFHGYQDATGLEPITEGISFAGATDRGIVKKLLLANQIEFSESIFRKILDAYLLRLPKYLETSETVLLPGVIDLLDQLSRRTDVCVGLLTGNLREGAFAKLRLFQLEQYFKFGGYGFNNADRNIVAEQALSAALEYADQTSFTKVIVLGDTEKDIECGRHIRAVCVGVATGFCEKSKLAAMKPDILLDDFSSPEPIFDLLSC